MKKITAMLLASCLMLLASACGDGNGDNGGGPTANGQPARETFYFAPDGLKIAINAEPAPVLAALGEALDQFDSESCAVDAKDTTYRFQGFELTVTCPARGADYITGIRLLDDSFTTPGGVRIGSEAAEIFAAYGTDYRLNNNEYTFTRGLSILKIMVSADGLVSQIIYSYDWDA